VHWVLLKVGFASAIPLVHWVLVHFHLSFELIFLRRVIDFSELPLGRSLVYSVWHHTFRTGAIVVMFDGSYHVS
jgi:hypothetical protein